jgi:hypothetical protein
MKIETKNVKQILLNPENPRIIKDNKFKKLVKSIKAFPQMLEIRPVVINKDGMVLGGNMRFKASIEAGLKEIPVIVADNLTKEQEAEFVLKDNISAGDWDWNQLASDWEEKELDDWGLNYEDFVHTSKFEPMLQPNTSYADITEERIKQEAEKLAKQMVNDMKMTDIICPNCEYEFSIEKK